MVTQQLIRPRFHRRQRQYRQVGIGLTDTAIRIGDHEVDVAPHGRIREHIQRRCRSRSNITGPSIAVDWLPTRDIGLNHQRISVTHQIGQHNGRFRQIEDSGIKWDTGTALQCPVPHESGDGAQEVGDERPRRGIGRRRQRVRHEVPRVAVGPCRHEKDRVSLTSLGSRWRHRDFGQGVHSDRRGLRLHPTTVLDLEVH